MYEVIIERPRGGAGWCKKRRFRAQGRAMEELELAPVREPMSMSRGSKWLNENLAPLRRFLLSRVGRRWDEVYAEICATLRLESAVQKHVLDHLRDMVYTRVVKAGDRLFEFGAMGVEEIRPCRWSSVYVCPETGVLKKVPRPRRYAPPVAREVVPIDSRAQYRKIGGLWYRLTLAPLPAGELSVRDVLLGDLRQLGTPWKVERVLREHYGRSDRYAVEKRQIGKRELRRLPPEVR
ncbi:MAG TPA: hypothetical protein VIK91_12560 [Nannocystis sp.]